MKITLSQLEYLLPKKLLTLHEETLKGHVLHGIYPALYIAARNDGIELIDAIIACRQCIVSTGILLGHFIRDRNISDVIRAIDYIDMQDQMSEKESVCRKRLANWLEFGHEVE
jgi:prenyltransferase beta subunit